MARMRSFRRSRGPRPRTRWVALTPHALGPFTANDSYDQQLMEIEDSAGPLFWTDYVGATVLRTIVDFVIDPIFTTPPGDNMLTSQIVCHLGIFMDEAAAPEQSRWDPNTPFGDFMWRKTWSGEAYWQDTASAAGGGYALADSLVVSVDSTQKRRVGEDMRMWCAAHYFERLGGSGADAALNIGYTGRVLLRLP